ncbi:MAG: hypothetical protein ACI8RD_007026 [Bacillariaceae sp.]|jgi:hypothetical protein
MSLFDCGAKKSRGSELFQTNFLVSFLKFKQPGLVFFSRVRIKYLPYKNDIAPINKKITNKTSEKQRDNVYVMIMMM